jgi:hypothetical protein
MGPNKVENAKNEILNSALAQVCPKGMPAA